ncbi:PhzF family phenazine biosynthesis protein [Chengkuizengella sediminis]|uniref:PhzF family phenazine biosynthesis protein n=1 Tax=Chengkuizengella sediminis TaxID=1885917 RepID=UPI001389406E|nr:PhzF family phenazine biosynthesis protein [Chengkuizengella sediminis]NDI34481.1 PhzF family phenazine biosynthesis protein [Chengkuizengella sediminis]
MKTQVYILSAFTHNSNGGNEAGVVLDTDQLEKREMKLIARKLGFSETAFIFSSTSTDFKVRYFTPKEEVDICGHATVAAFSLMNQKGLIDAGNFKIETKAGILNVEVYPNGKVFLEQNKPSFLDVISAQEITNSLCINKEDLIPHFPIQIVSTGLKDIIVPVNNLQVLQEMNPNMDEITNISEKYGVTGYHVFTLETIHNLSTAHCRNFAPLHDIPEESATGTSNAALVCYLTKYNRLMGRQDKQTFSMEQGYTMQKPSEIIIHISNLQGEISSVKVGGYGSNFKMELLEL